jgi:hypothetical protein
MDCYTAVSDLNADYQFRDNFYAEGFFNTEIIEKAVNSWAKFYTYILGPIPSELHLNVLKIIMEHRRI